MSRPHFSDRSPRHELVRLGHQASIECSQGGGQRGLEIICLNQPVISPGRANFLTCDKAAIMCFTTHSNNILRQLALVTNAIYLIPFMPVVPQIILTILEIFLCLQPLSENVWSKNVDHNSTLKIPPNIFWIYALFQSYFKKYHRSRRHLSWGDLQAWMGYPTIRVLLAQHSSSRN